MNGVAAVLAIWSVVAVQARPGDLLGGGLLAGGFGGHGGISSIGGGVGGGVSGPHSLEATPIDFGGLHYPYQDLQDLGTVYEGQIPPKTVKISNTVAIKIPKPYPVKVPHAIPIPVPVAKPYPVPVTQLIKVPHPVPVEVVKSVPVPVEVPKPYPVSSHEAGSGGLDSYGGGFGGHQHLSQSYNIPSTSYGEPIQGGYSSNGGGYDSYAGQSDASSGYDAGHEGQEDQSVGYAVAAAAPQEQNSGAEDGSHSE